MSCLTKKSLFFLVLSVVCNPAFSDRASECMGSVHEVFNETMHPSHHFKIAMNSISETLIKSKNNTQEYLEYYEDNALAITQFGENRLFNASHEETLLYFRSLIRWLRSPMTTAHYNIPLESKKQYVLGYFHSLIDHFDNSNLKLLTSDAPMDNRTLINILTNTPEIFCKGREEYLSESSCLEALYKMLWAPHKPNDCPENMDGFEIFKYCYKTFNYLDFTLDKYYPEALYGGHYETQQKEFRIAIMAAYLSHITSVAEQLVDNYREFGLRFPTIQQFCSAGSST